MPQLSTSHPGAISLDRSSNRQHVTSTRSKQLRWTQAMNPTAASLSRSVYSSNSAVAWERWISMIRWRKQYVMPRSPRRCAIPVFRRLLRQSCQTSPSRSQSCQPPGRCEIWTSWNWDDTALLFAVDNNAAFSYPKSPPDHHFDKETFLSRCLWREGWPATRGLARSTNRSPLIYSPSQL